MKSVKKCLEKPPQKCNFFFLYASEVDGSMEDCQSQIWDLKLSVSGFDHKRSCDLDIRLHHHKLF